MVSLRNDLHSANRNAPEGTQKNLGRQVLSHLRGPGLVAKDKL
jgi:hypothetical protein